MTTITLSVCTASTERYVLCVLYLHVHKRYMMYGIMYVCAFVCTYMYVCVSVCVHKYMYAYLCACVHVIVCVCARVRARVCVCVWCKYMHV